MTKFSQEIEVSGHLIDSLILTKIFDKIMDLKGEFEVQKIKIGKRKKDQSYAQLLVTGKNQKHLDKILETIMTRASTGKVGDGKIFLSEVSEVVQIRTQERVKH